MVGRPLTLTSETAGAAAWGLGGRREWPEGDGRGGQGGRATPFAAGRMLSACPDVSWVCQAHTVGMGWGASLNPRQGKITPIILHLSGKLKLRLGCPTKGRSSKAIHACNPNMQEAEAGGPPRREFRVSLSYIVRRRSKSQTANK